MLDLGLIITGGMIWAGLSAAARWAPVAHHPRAEIMESLYWPLLAGLLASRVSAVALDDPASLTSIRALLVVRGGVEFWAGVAVFAAVLFNSTRRRHRQDWGTAVAELAPFAMWVYAAYEASCIYRDGCYGPSSSVGLVPHGLDDRQVPVGLLVGVAVVGLGILVRHLRGASPAQRLLLGLAGVAVTRSVASVWLPRLGDGPTRQHLESIAVAVAAIAMLVVLRLGPEPVRRAAEGRSSGEG